MPSTSRGYPPGPRGTTAARSERRRERARGSVRSPRVDIYSTAKRLGQPFRFPGLARELPIGVRGIIGDGITCALVRPDGAIDWMCVPRFDGPSVFGAILDPERGGLTAITPVGPFESLQRYDPRTNVLETLFRQEGGAVRLDDFHALDRRPALGIQEVHRRIACMEGTMTLEVVFDPRFGYGAATTRIDAEEHGLLATGAGERLAAVVGADVSWESRDAGGLSARLTLRRERACGWCSAATRPGPSASPPTVPTSSSASRESAGAPGASSSTTTVPGGTTWCAPRCSSSF